MSAQILSLGQYTAHVEDAGENEIELTVFVSTDQTPMKEFRPVLTCRLDEMHALELFGTLSIAMARLRERREATVITKAEGEA